MRIVLNLLLLHGLLLAQDIDVPTPRGAALKASVHVPKQPNGTAIVFAPGQGYHKELPLIKTGAETLAAGGFVVVRFDWAYFTAKQRPSPGFVQELEDLEAVLKYARERKDVRRVILAGKSLGSLIAAMRAAKKSDDLAGVALLTFPIHPQLPQHKSLLAIQAPTLVVCGNADRLCNPKQLYALAAQAKQQVDVVIIAGDHGFKEKQEGRTDENLALAMHALLDWAKRR